MLEALLADNAIHLKLCEANAIHSSSGDPLGEKLRYFVINTTLISTITLQRPLL